MPTYAYLCRGCGADFDVIRPISEIDAEAVCTACAASNNSSARQLPSRTHVYGAAVEDAVYDPVFGQVIKDKKHRAAEAKARGWIEVGNEKPEEVHAMHDRQREETRQQRYREAVREKVYGD